MVSAKIRSMVRFASLSSDQPKTSFTGAKLLRLSRSPQRNGLACIENPAQG